MHVAKLKRYIKSLCKHPSRGGLRSARNKLFTKRAIRAGRRDNRRLY